MTATPADLAALLRGAARYRSAALVRARQLPAAREWSTPAGSALRARAGDWELTDGASTWTVRAEVFARTYVPAGNGRYTKPGTVEAVRLSGRLVVPTLEGPSVAAAGDWLLRGADGDVWPVPDAHFRAHYRPA